MNPTATDVHVDAALSEISLKYTNDKLIGKQIAKVIPVNKDSNIYFVYGKQNLKRYNLLRAPGTRAEEVEYKVEKASPYVVQEYSNEVKIPDEVRDNADEPLKPDIDATEYGTEINELDLEGRIADFYADVGNYGDGTGAGSNSNVGSPNNKWDTSDGDPQADVDDAKETVHTRILKWPNTLVVSSRLHKFLRRNPKLRDIFKYTKGQVLTVDMLKEVFEVDDYLIGESVYDSAKENLNSSNANLWADEAILLYVPKSPGIKQVAHSYTFQRKGFPQVEGWREEAIKSEWKRVSNKYDHKLIDPYAGFLITAPLSA
jgi:hypothetical protein